MHTDLELPCLLALWLSICPLELNSLRYSDIENGIITVNHTMADAAGTPPANVNIIRRFELPGYILRLIDQADHTQEYIVPLA